MVMRNRIAVATAMVLMAGMLASPVLAQNRQQGNAAAQGAETLPPALRAAIQSGNGAAVAAAIATLSGGNSQRAAALADQTIRAAERLLETNPQAAIAIARVAVETVRSETVQSSSPQQTQDVVTTAARIFISPTAQRVAPQQTAELATAAVQVASTTRNPSFTAGIAAQAVATAEKVLAAAPVAAVQVAGAAVQAVKSQPVLNSSPQKSLETVTIAARIIITPEAQRIGGDTIKAIATGVSDTANNPTMTQYSPTAAKDVGDKAKQAGAPEVAAVPPTTPQTTPPTTLPAKPNNNPDVVLPTVQDKTLTASPG